MPSPRSARSLRGAAAGVIGLSAFVLSACSNPVSLQPAADSNDPLCAAVTVRLPDVVGGAKKRYTDAQATGAWGNPVSIIMTCGIEPPGPSDLPCYTLGGVDWLALPQEEDIQRAVTFGRDPAIEVAVGRDVDLDFATVLEELGRKIAVGIPDQAAICSITSPAP